MADEILIEGRLQVNKGFVKFAHQPGLVSIDMSGDHHISKVADIGTSHESLDLGDVSTPGWAFFRNVDSTNYIEIGVQDGESTFIGFIKLNPGEYTVLPLGAAAPYAKANTSTAKLEYRIVEA